MHKAISERCRRVAATSFEPRPVARIGSRQVPALPQGAWRLLAITFGQYPADATRDAKTPAGERAASENNHALTEAQLFHGPKSLGVCPDVIGCARYPSPKATLPRALQALARPRAASAAVLYGLE